MHQHIAQHRIFDLGVGLRIVAAIVQATAFAAAQGAADDQVGGDHQIAQFQQVIADTEMGVVLVDFALQ